MNTPGHLCTNGMSNSRHSSPFANAAIQEAVAAVENELEEQGRVVLRASGTEPVIRVMVEGKNKEQIVTLAKRLASVVAESAT